MMNKKDWLNLINTIPDGADDVYIVFKCDIKDDARKLDITKKIYTQDELELHQIGDEIRLIEDIQFNTLEMVCKASI